MRSGTRLTPRRWQSGSSIDVRWRISKAGDGDVRRALYEAASALLMRFKRKRKDKVKTWGLLTAKRAGHREATHGYDFSTAHGAYETGTAAATAALKGLRR